MTSWRRPSNSSSRLTGPSGPSKRYSFSTASHGIRRRLAASASRARVSLFSSTSSAWRAASHSCGVTTGGVSIWAPRVVVDLGGRNRPSTTQIRREPEIHRSSAGRVPRPSRSRHPRARTRGALDARGGTRRSELRFARRAAPAACGRSEPQRGADRDHRGASGVHNLDDLAAVDALEVDGGDAEVAVSKLALDHDQRDAFASHLDRVGVAELMWREAAPHSYRGGGASQLGACRGGRPVASARRAVDDAEERTDRQLAPQVEPRLEFFPSPRVHADLATAPALAAPDQE